MDDILKEIKAYPTDSGKIYYIGTLPRMGPKMRYHLARNIGIDTVKPDIWMFRLIKKYGFESPEGMCNFLTTMFPQYRIGTIDVILWRYCNLTGDI